MNRYTVRSRFLDSKGKELFERKTFDGAAEDAREALVEAHKEMQRIGEADPRVDSIGSSVKGPNEEISTTDYLDELGSGMSQSGLMEEVNAADLEPQRGNLVRDAVDAIGGVPPSQDNFLGQRGGRDDSQVREGAGGGADATQPIFATGGQVAGPAPGWGDPGADPLADIQAGRRRIEEESYGRPAWLTPDEFLSPKMFPHIPARDDAGQVEYDLGKGTIFIDENPDADEQTWKEIGKVKEFKIRVGTDERAPFVKPRKTVSEIFAQDKAEVAAGKPTLLDFAKAIADRRLTEAQRDMLRHIEQRNEPFLGQRPEDTETEA